MPIAVREDLTTALSLSTIVIGLVLVLAAVACYDLAQRKHVVLRNFPIVGHFRYLLESVGPELRQYIVTDNNEERPFSRDQRGWLYASSKLQNNYFGFGSDNDLELSPNYIVIKHSAFPMRSPLAGDPDYDESYTIPATVVCRWVAPEGEGIPARIGRQRLGHELRFVERAGGGSAQPCVRRHASVAGDWGSDRNSRRQVRRAHGGRNFQQSCRPSSDNPRHDSDPYLTPA